MMFCNTVITTLLIFHWTVAGTTACPVKDTILNVHAIKPRSLSVSWIQPKDVNITSYLIEYSETVNCLSSNTFLNRTVLSPHLVNHTITELKTWKCYQVRLAIITTNGTCYSNTSVGRTLEEAPGEFRMFGCGNITETSIEVKWLLPLDSNGILQEIQVNWTNANSSTGTGRQGYASLNGTTTNHEVGSLNAYTRYEFTIRARTSAGWGNISNAACTTGEGVPGPPNNFMVVKVLSRAVTVQWQQPEIPNGVVTKFRVFYKKNSSLSWMEETYNSTVKTETVSKLDPYTWYVIKMQAATQRGWGKNSTIKTFQTEEEAPSRPPSNITGKNLSSTSIEVTWDPPPIGSRNGILRFYKIRYREVKCTVRWKNITGETTPVPFTTSVASPTEPKFALEPTRYPTRLFDPVPPKPDGWTTKRIVANQTKFPISTLSGPWVCVEIQVLAVTIADGPFSNTLHVRSDEDVPGAPSGLTARNLTSKSLAIQWTAPANPNGIVITYKMVYKKAYSATWIVKSFVSPVTADNLTNLDPYTWYDIKVRAATRKGYGNFSKVLQVLTDEDLPSAPASLTVANLSSTSLLVNWSRPLQTNGLLTEYMLKHRLVVKSGESANPFTEKAIAPTKKFEILSGLVVYSDYEITVSAKTSKGYGPSVKIVVKTDQDVPSAPEGFAVQAHSAFYVSLNWKQLADDKGVIRGYKIQKCTVNVTGHEKCSPKNELSESFTFYNFSGLQPYTNYTFRLYGFTEKGEGFPAIIHQRTKEYVPSQARNVTVSLSTPTSLTVSWLSPQNPNGLVYYDVFYRLAMEDQSKNNFSETTRQLSATVRKLEEFHNYIVTIQAFTKTGGRAAGAETRGQTLEAVPSGPPLEFKAIPFSSTAFDLSWKHPERLKRNGIIVDYEITYNVSGSTKSRRVGSNDTKYTLQNLMKYQVYKIQVYAENAVGKGPPAYVIERTKEDVPGPAFFSYCKNLSKNSIEIAWNAPKEPNGIITKYNLTWSYSEELSTTTERSNFKVFGPDDRMFKVENLEIFSRYKFTITARTQVGIGPSVSDTCRTGEYVPTKPKTVRVVTSTFSSILVEWEKPERPNGVILGYKVTWGLKNNDKKLNSGESKHIELGVQLRYNITGLKPFTLYRVEVSGRTSIGYGDSNSIDHKTNESLPSAVRAVSYTVNETAVFFRWEEPAEKNGVVRYRIYYRMAIGGLYPIKEFKIFAETDRRQQVIPGLEEYIDYQFKIVPFTGAGEGVSADYNLTTLAAAPSGPPLNVTAKALTSRSVHITWQPPSFFDRNGKIKRYRIRMLAPRKEEGNTTDTFFTLRHLEEYQWYNFTIEAMTYPGYGPPQKVSVRTLEDKPGKPRLQGYINISSTEMQVFWKPPTDEDLNGIITNYNLTLWPKSNPAEKRTFQYKPEVMSATFKNLEKYTQYVVKLEAATSKGWGPADEATYLTKDDKPDGPPLAFKAINVLSTSVKLDWSAPLKVNGIVRRYLVRFYKTNQPNEKTTRVFLVSPGTVVDLKPYENYGFEIACESSGGEGPYSKTVIAKTKADRPPKPSGTVPPLAVGPTYKSFTIRLWKASDDHGLVQYYWVVVQELHYDINGKLQMPAKSPDSLRPSDIVTHREAKEDKKEGRLPRPYITGYITRNDFPKDGIFEVGDGRVYSPTSKRRRRSQPTGGYWNGDLDPSTSYMVFERAFVSKDLYISGKWIGPFETKAKPKEETPSSAGAIAGAVVGVLLVAFLVCGAIYYARRQGLLFVKKKPPPVAAGEQISLTTPGRENVAFDGDYRPQAGNVKIENFASHHQNLNKDGKFLFSEEFKLIRNGEECTYEHSHHELNREKNRYTNIVAYDNSRVTLSQFDGSPESDYINANYIDGFSSKREYIATQGPLENTAEDFWRMIWEQDTGIIVMLTRLEENGKIKCYQYWPEAGSMRYGCMQITTVEAVELPDYSMRTFSVINNLFPSQEKFVKQFHFLAWPDHGVPSSQAILSFLRRVRASTASHGGPSVVHCSAGVGRTGTYILLDANLQRIAKDSTIEIFHFLQNIRKQRNFMVQTESQYVFIHDALLEYLNCGSTEIAAKDLRDYVKKLQRPLPNSDELSLDREFMKLNSYDRMIQKSFTAANMMSNKTKNRFLNILPFDDTRVCLTMVPGVQGSDYINASFIDGYTYQKAFIATQAPLPSTIPDFWRMIWEQRCTTIVCLVRENENSKMVKVHRYWPQIESAIHGHFIIEQLPEKKQTDLIIRDLKITHTQEGHSRDVRMFHFVGWPDNSMPENGASMIELIGQVQRWQEQTGNHAAVVHCSTGVGRTGVFIAVFNMIQRVRSEGVVDVFQTVRKLRLLRPAMVQTKAQYLFCYVVLQDYLASFDLHDSYI